MNVHFDRISLILIRLSENLFISCYRSDKGNMHPASPEEQGAAHIGEENRVIGYEVPVKIHNILRKAFPPLFGMDRGHQLDGHVCLGELDKKIENTVGGSLLYGEVLPEGVSKLCDFEHTHIMNALTVFDYGMGTGKLCVQIFFQFPHLVRVVGVEISPSRYDIAAAALRRLARCRRGLAIIADSRHSCVLIDTRGHRRRVLEFRCCDVFDSLHPQTLMAQGDPHYNEAADIIFMNTDFPAMCQENLGKLFHSVRNGCRIATYSDVKKEYQRLVRELKGKPPSATSEGSGSVLCRATFPLWQHTVNVSAEEDRFRTTWSTKLGHHFHTWTKGSLQAGHHTVARSPADTPGYRANATAATATAAAAAAAAAAGASAAAAGVTAGKKKAASGGHHNKEEMMWFWAADPTYNACGGHKGSAMLGTTKGGASVLPAGASVAFVA